MRKLIAITVVLGCVACGSGANDVAPIPDRTQAVIVPGGGACTNDPTDCGVKVCIDCTKSAPPGTTARCVKGECSYACAIGFHSCDLACVRDDNPNDCGLACVICDRPPNSKPICVGGACDFVCETGFFKSAGGCAPLSFSTSY